VHNLDRQNSYLAQIPIIYSLIQHLLCPEGIDVKESVTNATNYAKDILHIDRNNDPVGPLIGIVTIPN